MYKKTMTYINTFDEEVTEDLYFNLTQPEQAKLEADYVRNSDMSLNECIKAIMATKDLKAILATIEDFLLRAYGERTPDGRGFEKNAEIRERFSNSIVYGELFEEIINKPELLTEILNGALSKPGKKSVVNKQTLVQ